GSKAAETNASAALFLIEPMVVASAKALGKTSKDGSLLVQAEDKTTCQTTGNRRKCTGRIKLFSNLLNPRFCPDFGLVFAGFTTSCGVHHLIQRGEQLRFCCIKKLSIPKKRGVSVFICQEKGSR
ncbi:MAG: hypothetical protein RR757_06595, partial [Raoultibacter sp.]